MSITYHMMTNFSEELRQVLDMGSLGKPPQEILKMMEEDKSVSLKWKSLEVTIQKCKAALDIIDSF